MTGCRHSTQGGSLMNRVLAPALLSAACLAACNSSDKTPTASNPAPTPTPAPAATPQAFSCPLAAMPDLHNTCPKLTPQLNEYVDKAIAQTVKDHPGLFDLRDDLFNGNYRVLDPEQVRQGGRGGHPRPGRVRGRGVRGDRGQDQQRLQRAVQHLGLDRRLHPQGARRLHHHLLPGAVLIGSLAAQPPESAASASMPGGVSSSRSSR